MRKRKMVLSTGNKPQIGGVRVLSPTKGPQTVPLPTPWKLEQEHVTCVDSIRWFFHELWNLMLWCKSA